MQACCLLRNFRLAPCPACFLPERITPLRGTDLAHPDAYGGAMGRPFVSTASTEVHHAWCASTLRGILHLLRSACREICGTGQAPYGGCGAVGLDGLAFFPAFSSPRPARSTAKEPQSADSCNGGLGLARPFFALAARWSQASPPARPSQSCHRAHTSGGQPT